MADRYATEAARIATLSLIDAAGFDVVQQSCVDMLADLLLRYLHEAGAGSHHYAELAGRIETNPIDVALALTDMGTSVAQLRDFMKHSEEVPFEQSISAFPLRKQSRPAPTFMDRGEAPPPHIPPWLPALPDKHTYVATPVYAGHEQDPQKQQMLLTEQRQQAEEAAVRLQARLSADSNQLLAAKLQRTKEAVAEEAAAAAAAAQEAGVQQQQQNTQQQDQEQDQEASEQPNAASSNPFIAGQWGDLTSELLWYQRREQQREQQRERGEAAGHLPVTERVIEHGPAGPSGVWEEAAGLEPGAGGDGAASGFVAQQLFASTDWKAQQQRTARVATGGRAVKDAFADAYDEVAAARLGKRHKRAQGAVPAVVHDPTRARVEGILAASAPQPVAPVAAQDTVMTEEI